MQDVHHTGGTPHGQMNQPRRSMQRQFSLVSQRSLRSQISRRSMNQATEPPGKSKVADAKEATEAPKAVSSAQADGDQAPAADSNEAQEGSGRNPRTNLSGHGTPLSQVAKSAFEGWNAEGQPAESDRPDQVKPKCA